MIMPVCVPSSSTRGLLYPYSSASIWYYLCFYVCVCVCVFVSLIGAKCYLTIVLNLHFSDYQWV